MDKYCRLCLSMTTENFYEINNSKYRKQIETVIPELNIQNIRAPLLCQKCSIVLEASYELKTRSLRIDSYLSVFVDIMQTDVVPVSEIYNIKKELDGDLKPDTKDYISFVNIKKIEENTALCDDDTSVGLTAAIPSRVKVEPKDDLTMMLDKENHTALCGDVSVGLTSAIPSRVKIEPENDLTMTVDRENHTALCEDDACLTTLIPSSVKVEPKDDFTMTLDKENHQSVDLDHQSALQKDPEYHENATQNKNVPSVDLDRAIPKPFACKICRKRFAQENDLKNHVSVKHKDATKEHPRKGVRKNMRSKTGLSKHHNNQQHRGENEIRCKLCNRRCVTAWDLKKHVRIHGFGMQLV